MNPLYSNTTLIVSTYENNKYLLNNFFKLLKINFPSFDGDIKITINSEYKYGNYNISIIRKKLKDTSFSTSLIQTLKEIKSDYVLFMLEDFYLLNKVNEDVIKSAIEIMDNDKEISFIQLNDQSFIKQYRYSKKVYNQYFLVKNDKCPYSCNAQFGLWRKKLLLKILRVRETAWNFEYYGSYRLNRIKHKSLTINDKYKQGSNLYPDGGILYKGTIIDRYNELFSKFSLDKLENKQNSIAINQVANNVRFKNNRLFRFYNKIYPILTLYFPFIKKIGNYENFIPPYIEKEFDSQRKTLEDYKKENITVGVLYIATGKYIMFWKEFYKYAQKHFLPNYKKIYYLFTDADIDVPDGVKLIYQKNLGWPNNTLLRYEMFLKHKDIMGMCNYLYFINANMVCVRDVGPEIFPSKEQKLMVTIHPCYYQLERKIFTYETRKESTAYISPNEGKYYFMGGFNGGITDEFLSMAKDINDNIYKDFENNIVAIWHDESHLNKYMVDKNPLILDSSYAIPEGIPYNFNNLKSFKNNYKFLIKDKSKYGGEDYLRK